MSVWSTPLPSTSVAPFAERQVSSVTARATTTADFASAPGRESTTVTRQDADSRLRPVRPCSAVPAATCASVRASALPGTTQAASAAAGSAAVTAAVRASRYAVAAASGPAAAASPAVCPTAAGVPAAAGAAAANAAATTAAATMSAQCRLFILTPFWRVMGWWRRL